jgi:hypothetical protein
MSQVLSCRFYSLIACWSAFITRSGHAHPISYFGIASEPTISEEIEQIDQRCFAGCESMCFVCLGPDSKLTSIEAGQFADCDEFFDIEIHIRLSTTSSERLPAGRRHGIDINHPIRGPT